MTIDIPGFVVVEFYHRSLQFLVGSVIAHWRAKRKPAHMFDLIVGQSQGTEHVMGTSIIIDHHCRCHCSRPQRNLATSVQLFATRVHADDLQATRAGVQDNPDWMSEFSLALQENKIRAELNCDM